MHHSIFRLQGISVSDEVSQKYFGHHWFEARKINMNINLCLNKVGSGGLGRSNPKFSICFIAKHLIKRIENEYGHGGSKCVYRIVYHIKHK